MRLSDKILHSAVPSSGREAEEGRGGVRRQVGGLHPQNVTVYINTNVSFPKVTFNRGGRVSENKRTSGRKVGRPIPFFFTVRFLADNRPRRRPLLSDKTGARGGGGGGGAAVAMMKSQGDYSNPVNHG